MRRRFIVSQDRKSVVEIKSQIGITRSTIILGFSINCAGHVVGHYVTEEKAKAVLESIWKFLIREGTLNDTVYLMPEETDFTDIRKGADSDE